MVDTGSHPVALIFCVQQVAGTLLLLADGTTRPVPAGPETGAGPIEMTGGRAEIVALAYGIEAGAHGLTCRIAITDIAQCAVVFRVRISGMRRTGPLGTGEPATLTQTVAGTFTAVEVHTEIGHAIGVFIARRTVIEFRLALPGVATCVRIAIVIGGAGIRADRRSLLGTAVAVDVLVVATPQSQDRIGTRAVVVMRLAVADECTADGRFAVSLTRDRVIAIG